MSDHLAQDAAQGQRADLLLADPLVTGAFEALERDYVKAWTETPANATEARERLWQAYQIVGKVRSHLQSIASDGALARKELDELQTLGERRKLLGVF